MAAIFAERAAATGRLGRIGLILEAVPDVLLNAWLVHWEVLRQDLRYAARTLWRAPGFALTAILVTALGVGANTAAFSLADLVLLRPLPFPEPDALVRLCEGPRTGGGWGCMNELSPANYRDFKEQTRSFEALGAFRRDAANVVGEGEPQRLEMALVTPEVLPLLGLSPILGRVFEPGNGAADARAVVLSHGLWQARFGGDRDILGRTVSLDGTPHTIIGVMPPAFHFPTREVQLWAPLQLVEEDFVDRNNTYIHGVGRMAPGVTFERALADLHRVADQLAREYPETNQETGVSFFRLRDEFSPRYRLMLQALMGASLCILLLACANLGNLLLARAGARERELAVRAALGAGKERLVRQMITESIALAVLGGAAGVVVALLVFPLLSLMVPPTLALGNGPGLNLRLLGLAALFTAITGVGFGVVPALRAGGRAAPGALRGGLLGGRGKGFRSVLVGIEVAASVVLMVASGLLIRAVLRVQDTEPGFRSEGVLTLRTVLPKPRYLAAETRDRFYREVLAEVRRLPEVRSAAFTSGLPMVMTGGIGWVALPGEEARRDRDANYTVSRRYVTPQFFGTLGIPLVGGRDLEEADTDGRRRVAVVSESFAGRYWPDADALGKTFLFQDSTWTVVGVVGDIMVRGLERTSEPQMYLPPSLTPEGPLSFYDPKDLIIRTEARPADLVPAVREIIDRVDADQPVSNVSTLNELLANQTAPRWAQIRVLAALAAVALVLSGLGLHGLLSYMVTTRRREIGVRLALGAEPGRIARRVVWDGVSLALIGLVPGLFFAFAAGRSLSALLFGVPPGDPATILVAVGLCLAMAVTGALLPARRAVGVDPISVLRSE
jgi:predicted permease